MTLPSSGPLSMSAINVEFSRGLNLNSYRGTVWWTDAGATGQFSSGTIQFSEFYGKRSTNPSGGGGGGGAGEGGGGPNSGAGGDPGGAG